MLSERLTVENIEYKTFDTNFTGQISPERSLPWQAVHKVPFAERAWLDGSSH